MKIQKGAFLAGNVNGQRREVTILSDPFESPRGNLVVIVHDHGSFSAYSMEFESVANLEGFWLATREPRVGEIWRWDGVEHEIILPMRARNGGKKECVGWSGEFGYTPFSQDDLDDGSLVFVRSA